MVKLVRGYPEYMLESIEKVHRTRDIRMKEGLKDLMSMDDREEILNKYHPDYKPDYKRKIKVGPSKNEEALPHEFADLLEAHPAVIPDEVDLTSIDYDVDVLVIGGGGAGTVASLWAHYEGVPADNILMVTKLRHGDSNSMMAQGGIQSSDAPNDTPLKHFIDALGGGHFTNDRKLLRALVEDAPEIIDWHESLGVNYDRNEEGEFTVLPGGGTSVNRMHAAKDYTGMEILRVLRDEFRNLDIPVIEFAPAVEIILDEQGNAAGAVLVNIETGQYHVVRAKSVVFTTGGYGRLHLQNFATTNHYGATADGLVMAYHAGVPLVDMDSAQYHPTGVAYPQPLLGLLVTEKTRSLGGEPVNINGESFVNPLEPRDVEASALIRECYGRELGVETPSGFRGVWLDSPRIEQLRGEGTIEKELNAMYRMFKRFGIDMTKDPVLVFPTLHYQNGGMYIDKHGSTNITGLFAGGECAGGVHGKNRLMGNSLLDYNVFGRRAGISAGKHALKVEKPSNLSLSHLTKYEQELEKAKINTTRTAPILLPDYRNENVIDRTLPKLKI